MAQTTNFEFIGMAVARAMEHGRLEFLDAEGRVLATLVVDRPAFRDPKDHIARFIAFARGPIDIRKAVTYRCLSATGEFYYSAPVSELELTEDTYVSRVVDADGFLEITIENDGPPGW